MFKSIFDGVKAKVDKALDERRLPNLLTHFVWTILKLFPKKWSE